MTNTELVLVEVEGEPRIRDVDLGERLGFERPTNIRQLIERNRKNLSKISVLHAVQQTPRGEGGRPSKAFFLDKKQAIFITAKSETATATDITIEIIERFDAYERGVRSPPAAMGDDEIMARAVLLAGRKIDRLQQEVAGLIPKAEALERIAGTEGSHCITDAAKALQVRPTTLFDYLSQHKWIYRRVGADHWCAYQSHIASGDLVHKVATVLRADGSERATEQVRVTTSGLTKLSKLMPPAAREAPLLDLLHTH